MSQSRKTSQLKKSHNLQHKIQELLFKIGIKKTQIILPEDFAMQNSE